MNGAPPQAPDWLVARFPELQNLRPLSRGGQKEVYSGLHPTDGEVVLKLMHPGADIERVRREVAATARVSSPRVPAVLECGVVNSPTGDFVWIREQRVPGQSLRNVLTQGPLRPPQLLQLGLHVSETLVAAEAARIVHRDVKPENIIAHGAGGYWVIDFGLARHLGLDSLTATANAFGNVTWGYAPPEQCRNIKQEIDGRADLFALGVTLYESATGTNPYRAGARDVLEVLKRVETTSLPRLALPFPSSAEFADLISALTQRQRIHRPPSVAEAHQWIREICEREGVA